MYPRPRIYRLQSVRRWADRVAGSADPGSDPDLSHTLNSRSIVFSGEECIRIRIGEGRHGGADESCVTFDGDSCFQVKSGDYVEIQKAAEVTRIIKINQVSFLEVLREKLSRS